MCFVFWSFFGSSLLTECATRMRMNWNWMVMREYGKGIACAERWSAFPASICSRPKVVVTVAVTIFAQQNEKLFRFLFLRFIFANSFLQRFYPVSHLFTSFLLLYVARLSVNDINVDRRQPQQQNSYIIINKNNRFRRFLFPFFLHRASAIKIILCISLNSMLWIVGSLHGSVVFVRRTNGRIDVTMQITFGELFTTCM